MERHSRSLDAAGVASLSAHDIGTPPDAAMADAPPVDETHEERSSSEPAKRSSHRAMVLLQRVAIVAITLGGISIITFFGTSIKSPDEIARASLGRFITPEQSRAFIAQNDLDLPLLKRYFNWMANFLQGDFGTSYITHRPVRVDLMPRLLDTSLLTALTLVFAVPLGVALGVISARRVGRRGDIVMNTFAVVITALPEFVIGLLLLIVFGVKLHLLPVDSGQGMAFGTFGDKVEAFAAPTITLIVVSVPFILRSTRIAVRETLAAPYTKAAVLHGIPRRRVVWHHATRNAAGPILNAVALVVIYLLGGVIVVEHVFGFPGLGSVLVNSVGNGDTISVQAAAMLLGSTFIAVSMVTDAISAALNPETRGGR